MEGYTIVHKVVLFDENAKMCMVFLKLLNQEDLEDIRFKAGIVTKTNPENVDVDDLRRVADEGLELASGSLDLFILKKDFDEEDLLEDEEQVAIRIEQ